MPRSQSLRTSCWAAARRQKEYLQNRYGENVPGDMPFFPNADGETVEKDKVASKQRWKRWEQNKKRIGQ